MVDTECKKDDFRINKEMFNMKILLDDRTVAATIFSA
jgi:hypothetical protein